MRNISSSEALKVGFKIKKNRLRTVASRPKLIPKRFFNNKETSKFLK